jgi:hypothetical protein
MLSIPTGLRGLRKYAAKALAVTLAVIASVLPPAGHAGRTVWTWRRRRHRCVVAG